MTKVSRDESSLATDLWCTGTGVLFPSKLFASRITSLRKAMKDVDDLPLALEETPGTLYSTGTA